MGIVPLPSLRNFRCLMETPIRVPRSSYREQSASSVVMHMIVYSSTALGGCVPFLFLLRSQFFLLLLSFAALSAPRTRSFISMYRGVCIGACVLYSVVDVPGLMLFCGLDVV